MIRLTRQVIDNAPVLKLEGDLSHEVVDLVRQECRPRPPGDGLRRLLIDLHDLKSADEAGLKLLRSLIARSDVEFINCSPIWHTLIRGLPE